MGTKRDTGSAQGEMRYARTRTVILPERASCRLVIYFLRGCAQRARGTEKEHDVVSRCARAQPMQWLWHRLRPNGFPRTRTRERTRTQARSTLG